MVEKNICEQCRHENEAMARFCAECGSQLMKIALEADDDKTMMVGMDEKPAPGGGASIPTEPLTTQEDTAPTDSTVPDAVKPSDAAPASNLADLFEDRSPSMHDPAKTLGGPSEPPKPEPPKFPSDALLDQAVPDADQNATLNIPIVIQEMHCPVCNTELDASKHHYCWNCGTAVDVELEPCRNCQANTLPDAAYCHHCGVRIEPIPIVTLNMVENNQEYRIPKGAKVYMVGRTVPQQGIYVDLDLGPFGQRKVSRQHARFVLRDNKWYLEDMNSKAGTRIFNTQAEPLMPVLIEDGMVIYFADLKFKVSLKYS